MLRGRLEALGPVENAGEDPLLLALEAEGVVLRTRIDGRPAWCDRRLLARIHRYTLDRLRREIAPVTASQFLRFLARWQHVAEAHRLTGPAAWPRRSRSSRGSRRPPRRGRGASFPRGCAGTSGEWLDQLTLSGEVVWGRLWGAGLGPARRAGTVPLRRAPISLVPREDLEAWRGVAAGAGIARPEPAGSCARVCETLAARGAMFFPELLKATGLTASVVQADLEELIGLGRVTCDAYSGLRALLVPAWKRLPRNLAVGRWSLLEDVDVVAGAQREASIAFLARRLLARTGVIFRKTLARERQPVPWRDLVRALRAMELRGDVRGGRFVAGFDGEQYALPEAIPILREERRAEREAAESADPSERTPPSVSAADPLNFRGILTPDERVSPATRRQVLVA